VKLAPDLVPAAALAGRLLGAAGERRKATRIIEAAWRANPHPDLADAFAHLQPGDSARQRLARVESLAGKATGDAEAAIAVARAALDAKEFGVARGALVPLLEMPTRRVSALMAALELQEGDEGRGREWMARTLNARRDPAWTADGFVSDHWLPVSPVTGRLDAFEWRDPLAGVDHTGATIDAEQRALLDAPRASLPPLAAPLPATDHSDAVVPASVKPEVVTPAAGKSDGAFPTSKKADAFTPTSDESDVDDENEPSAAERRASEPSSPHDEPRPPPVIALAHVPDDPGPESELPPEEPAVEPGSVAPPDGWSRFRARFK
jgi:HemY protein